MKTLVDLFSGCGGTSCGFHMAGWTPVCAVDMDENAIHTYAMNFKNAETICGDIRSAEVKKRLLKYRGVDAVIGGPPCQGFSKRNMITNSRYDRMNQLPFHFARIAVSLKPRVICMEEVAAATPIIEQVRRILETAGYDVQYRIILASDYQVPQNRKRLILVATYNATFSLPQTMRPISAGEALRKRPIPKRGEVVTDNAHKRIIQLLETGQRMIGGNYGVMDLNKPAPTIHTQTCSATGPFTIQRGNTFYGMSTEEAARLQSFPHSFKFYGTTTSIRRQIGNAVPPKLAQHLALGVSLERKIN